MNSIESLQNRGKGAAVTRKHGYKINTASIEAQHAAEEMMLQIENDMKNASAKLAAEQAERMVQDSIKASMERIDSENENMRTWEENMVRRSGYTVDGKSIHREAVVDSSLGHTYYEGQSVHYYEDFYDAGPTISVSLSKTMLEGLNSSAIMLLVEQANYDIENWSKQVFGNTEKDEEGNVVLKQNALAREASYDDDIERYKALSKKDYDKLSDSERKELNGLSTGIVSVRDGLLGEWTGYAPVFKEGNSGLDLSNSRESNIKYQGSGQMGQIMLDFQWNCMIEQQGWQKVALPAYDQPLWRGNGSWFEPPTIRGVASIVFEIVGQASSQTWFSYADDVIFAAIDLGGGFKSPEQVGLDLAKTAATAVISMGCSSAGSAVGNIAGKAMEGASKFANFAAQAGISAATSYATSVGTSFVNNWNLDANGNLAFDSESFGKSTYSAQTIAGSVGAGVTSGLTTAANMKMKSMGDNGAAVNKFYGTAVNAGISAAGKLSEYAVYSAYALAEGRSLADAYDDMGGLTFNIGSLGMFADMMASGIARNNATGQAGKFGEIAQKLEGKGILEINIGSNGITGKFGMGGFDLAGSLYTFGKRMSDKAALEAYAMQERVSKEEAETAYWGYVYGDWTQENTMARISSRRDELHIVDEMADGANAQTVQKADGSGRVITMKNTGDYHTNAVTLGHEAYRDGIVGNKADQQRETFNAVLGHTLMEARMLDYGQYSILEDENIRKDLMEYAKGSEAFAEYVNGNYDSSADYWKLMDDGSLAYDGNGNLYDEKGNLILNTGLGIQGGLQAILHINANEAVQLLENAGFEKDDSKTKCWELDANKGKIISFNNSLESGKTYEELYKTSVITDSITGVTATLEQHNPLNIYNYMVELGIGPYKYDNSIITSSNGQWNGRLPIQQLTYEEWKDNNYITDPSLNMISLSNPLVGEHTVTSAFGWRQNPFNSNEETFHTGTDFSTTVGTPIYPIFDGIVSFIGNTNYGGNTIILEHQLSYQYKGQYIETNYFTDYLHIQNNQTGGVNSSFNLGNSVTTNNILAYSGDTGPSTGPHLHAGIHFSSITNNPYANWLYQNGYIENQNFNNYYGNIYNFMR